MNPSGQCLTRSYLSLPRKMIMWKLKLSEKYSLKVFRQRMIMWKRKTFREGMATAAPPTVLDRLKERLVVALGKSQDKRVESKYKRHLFQVCRIFCFRFVGLFCFRFAGQVAGLKISSHPLVPLPGDPDPPLSAGIWPFFPIFHCNGNPRPKYRLQFQHLAANVWLCNYH